MAMKLPNQDRSATISNFIQFTAFIALFLLLYLPLRRITDSILLRILIFIGVYLAVSFVVFALIRPPMQRWEAKHRAKHNREMPQQNTAPQKRNPKAQNNLHQNRNTKKRRKK